MTIVDNTLGAEMIQRYEVFFTVPGKPEGKRRARFSTVQGYAKAYKPEEDKDYELAVIAAFYRAKPKNYTLYNKPIRLNVYCAYEIPKSFSKKKRQKCLDFQILPTVKPDLDNIVKILCDSLNKVAWYDDKQIASLVVRKYYSEEPKVMVMISEEKAEGIKKWQRYLPT